jgi:hypothetical protein
MDSLNPTLRDAILTAELNEEYYRHRGHAASRMSRWVQVLAAVTGASALGSWFVGTAAVGGTAQNAWAVLLTVSAALSISAPILRWDDDAVRFLELAAKWSGVAGRLRLLDLRARVGTEVSADLVAAQTEAEALQRDDTSLPNRKLIRELQAQIEVRHGLRVAAE